MYGDFSTFNSAIVSDTIRVLFQQGRAVLDADSNEQTSLLLNYLRLVARDSIPDGPIEGAFAIGFANDRLTLAPGRLWVDGLPVEYRPDDQGAQDLLPQPPAQDGRYLLYVDVWERSVNEIEDPSIVEVALGGSAGAHRGRLTWVVRAAVLSPGATADTAAAWDEVKVGLTPNPQGRLKAATRAPDAVPDPCVLPVDRHYLGRSNRLYRVEVKEADQDGGPALAWSRDNGSRVYKLVDQVDDSWRVVPPPDGALPPVGAVMELVTPSTIRRGPPGARARVVATDPDQMTITLDGGLDLQDEPPWSYLRQWDGYIQRTTSNSGAPLGPVDIEDGITVEVDGGQFDVGNFWLIPARVATGDIVWPQTDAGPALKAPEGTEHSYFPLRVVDATNGRWLSP